MNLRELAKRIRQDPKYTAKNSYDWFRKHVLMLGDVRPQRMVNQATFTNLMPGFMYLYKYDPKLKEKLPYWDRFPLIIPFNKDDEGFIGLNIHYLHPRTRLILLAKLHQFERVQGNYEKKLILKWEFIKSVSRYPEVQPCVKRYLWEHVRSKFLKVPDDDWVVVSQIPTQQFIGAKETKVWLDSRRKIGR